MKTLHIYLTRQVLATLGMTVLVCTFVLLLGNVLKEVLALLVTRQATSGVMIQAIALLIPFVLVFALPMGMLTATLLVFGRFSADQELTAVRANGVSLVALVTPILLLSVALSGLCAWFNLQVAPLCRQAYKDLLVEQGLAHPLSLLTEGRFTTEIPGYLIYVGKKKGDVLQDILISQFDGSQVMLHLRASDGQYVEDRANRQILLYLTNATGMLDPLAFSGAKGTSRTNQASSELQAVRLIEYTVDIAMPQTVGDRSKNISYSDMTFGQLWAEKEALAKYPYSLKPTLQLSPIQLRRELQELDNIKSQMAMPLLVQIHREVAFSFACIGFTLVGIPLGIRTHRRETSVGIALAIILVLVYYSFIVLAQSLQTHAEWAPNLILWLPNFLFQAVGAVLLWRANRVG